MSRFLTREDFEHACARAGIFDIERAGDGYLNPHTQATYLVWVMGTGVDQDAQPVGWVSRRNGKVVAFDYRRPRGPGSANWAQLAAKGWDFPLPVFPTVPALPKSAFTVVMERLRQLQQEGYTSFWDSQYTEHQLERAAACYALQAAGNTDLSFNRFWPWDNPIKRKSPEDSLVVAGALILAALDARADRAANGSVEVAQ